MDWMAPQIAMVRSMLPHCAGSTSLLTRSGSHRRALSRSPSPYRRRRTRSPSPYRRSRAVDRSPSPYRRSRGDRAQDNTGSSSHLPKRKTSPPRTHRPDKRHHFDYDRYNDQRRNTLANDARGISPSTVHEKERKDLPDRAYMKPISYAEVENPSAIPDFRDDLPVSTNTKKSRLQTKRETSNQKVEQDLGKETNQVPAPQSAPQSSVDEDSEMYVHPFQSRLYRPDKCLKENHRRCR